MTALTGCCEQAHPAHPRHRESASSEAQDPSRRIEDSICQEDPASDQTRPGQSAVCLDLQSKLTEGQQRLKTLSDQHMKVVNQTPMPEELEKDTKTFVSSLGIALTEEQRSQLHGLLKRPNADEDEINKRRKTDAQTAPPGGQCG